MKNFFVNFKAIIMFVFLIIELTIGFSSITIVNLPRPFVSQKNKISLAKVSNIVSDWTILGFKVIMDFFHRNKAQYIYESNFDRDDWCCLLYTSPSPRD